MKILILTHDEISLCNYRAELLQKLKEQNHEVTVAVPFIKERATELEPLADAYEFIPVDNRGLNPIKDLKLQKAYIALIKKVKPDVVLTIAVKPNIWGGMAAKKCKVPYYPLIQGLGSGLRRGGLITKLVKILYKKSLKKATKVLIEGQKNADVIAGMKLCGSNQICVLAGPGVNLEKFSAAEYPKSDQENIGFLYCSRVMKEKGVDELFVAFSRIKSEYPGCTLTVLGKCAEEYAPVLEQLEKEGVLTYKGFVADVKPYIEAAHCLVLPSYHEGVSIALLEAESMARPVVTTDADGCRECVEDGVNGYIVPVMDADALFEAMQKFIELTQEEKSEMAAQARRFVEKNYDRKDVVESIIAAITERAV